MTVNVSNLTQPATRPLAVRYPRVCWPNVQRLARERYEEGGIGFGKLADWVLKATGVRMSATTLRFWASDHQWRRFSQHEAVVRAKREEARRRLTYRCERCNGRIRADIEHRCGRIA